MPAADVAPAGGGLGEREAAAVGTPATFCVGEAAGGTPANSGF